MLVGSIPPTRTPPSTTRVLRQYGVASARRDHPPGRAAAAASFPPDHPGDQQQSRKRIRRDSGRDSGT